MSGLPTTVDSGLDSVCDEEPGRVQMEHTDLSVHARMSVFCFVTVCVGIIPKVSCLPDKAALLSCGSALWALLPSSRVGVEPRTLSTLSENTESH